VVILLYVPILIPLDIVLALLGIASITYPWSFILVVTIYTLLSWARSGQTVGKRIEGIRIVTTKNQPVGLGRAFLRCAALWTEVFLLPFLFLGFLWPLFDRRRQAWHDKIAGTIVIRCGKPWQLGRKQRTVLACTLVALMVVILLVVVVLASKGWRP
jgi:uncharacterized RDD family membrane protein YckC